MLTWYLYYMNTTYCLAWRVPWCLNLGLYFIYILILNTSLHIQASLSSSPFLGLSKISNIDREKRKKKMPCTYTTKEVHYHVRSISLPSRLQHPSLHNKIEKELKRLKTTWDVDASSLQGESIKTGLTGLAELYNSVEELILCPLNQKALQHQHHHHHVEKPLDMSIGLLEVCESAKEMMLLTKEHVLHLQSAFRRNGLEQHSSIINSHIGDYICFRKKARKDISKGLKALKRMERSFKSCSQYPLLDGVNDQHLLMVINVLRELSTITISFFKTLLVFMCDVPVLKKRSFFSRMVSNGSEREKRVMNEMGDIDVALCSFHRKIGANNNKVDLQIVKRRLGELDGSIRDLEEGLDCLFRCFIQQRVSLLNLLTPWKFWIFLYTCNLMWLRSCLFATLIEGFCFLIW